MRTSRFTEMQIVGILNQTEAGMKVKDLCRKHWISEATYYNWKAKLKRMYADLGLENRAMKDLIEKTLSDGIVMAVTSPAQTGYQVRSLEEILPVVTRVLTVLARMNDDLDRGLAPPYRHQQSPHD